MNNEHSHCPCRDDRKVADHTGCCGKSSCDSDGDKGCGCASHSHDDKHGGAKLIVSAIAIAISFSLSIFKIEPPLFPLTDPSWVAIFLCAIPIFKEAFHSLFEDGKITSNLLISVAMLGAFALQAMSFFGADAHGAYSENYIFAAAEIAFLMSLGEWLEEKTVKKSRSGIESLSKLMPQTALRKSGNLETEINVSDIEIGDVLCVRPHSVFAADGIILSGSASIDESAITGESNPAEKSVGDRVYAGTLNLSGYVEIKADKRSDESEVAKLAKIVEEAEGKKSPISRLADKCASYIVPLAMLLSLLVFVAAKFILGTDYLDAAIRAVTVLIVFCPCAFVLATPTAIASGLGSAARHGVLIKSGEALETLSKIERVFFDKTGTLTEAKIQVDKIELVGKFSENEVLKYAGSAEKYSEHPVGKAIYKYAFSRLGEIANSENIKSIVGLGIEADCFGKAVEVKKYSGGSDVGGTCVSVAVDGNIEAIIYLSDTIRPSSSAAIEALKSANINCSILSGDNRASAEKIAKSVGIGEVFAPILPSQKLEIISEAQALGEKICMVGDGVNDAPALAKADSSMAIACLKNDIAIGAAQISIAGDDLRSIPFAIRLSKRVMSTIKINITFSLIVNFGAVGLAFFALINPVAGALIHNLSSVCVVLNSARILRFK